jgi:hypothetical protein
MRESASFHFKRTQQQLFERTRPDGFKQYPCCICALCSIGFVWRDKSEIQVKFRAGVWRLLTCG